MSSHMLDVGVGYDASYKILIVGESGVGKTALIRSLMGDRWNRSHMTTVGVDFVTNTFDIDGATIQLQIWDTAGQERFRTITRFQYRGTKGLLLVYDITNGASFSMLNYWLESIDREIDRYTNEPIPVFVIGNKCDLEIQRAVTTEQGQKMADEHFVYGFLETSAKDGTNVQQAFSRLAGAITEIHNPKILNSYLTKEEKTNKMVRQTSKIFLQAEENRAPKKLRRNVSRIHLGFDMENIDEPVTKPDKCSCG